MRYVDSVPTTDLLGLVGRQVLVGERVMRQLGHAVQLWDVRREGGELMALSCILCGQEARISLIEMAEGAQYSVLLFPDGMCSENDRTLAPEWTNHADWHDGQYWPNEPLHT